MLVGPLASQQYSIIMQQTMLGHLQFGPLGAPQFEAIGDHNCRWDSKTLKAEKEWLGTVQLDLKANRVDVQFTIDGQVEQACGCAREIEISSRRWY